MTTAPRHRLSVIMPAYNAAGTIGRAIASIDSQDVDGCCLIICNDASTDRTLEEIERARKECRKISINVITLEKHAGYASAMARAMEEADSEYLICCDSDDRMLPGAIRAMLDEAGRTGADLVVAGYIEHKGERSRLIRPNRFESLNDMPIDPAHFSLCNKMFRTRIVQSEAMPYPGLDRWADLGVTARFMTAKPRIAHLEVPVYEYFINPGSLSRSGKEKLLADHLAIADLIIDHIEAKGMTDELDTFLLHLKFHAKVKYARAPGRDLRKWRRTYPEINSHILALRHVPLFYRLLFCLVR